MQNRNSRMRMTVAFVVLLTGAFVWSDTTQPPRKKLSIKDLLKSSSGSSRRGTTVAGVRGLDETGAGVDTKARDFRAVDRLEKVLISESDLNTFVKDGKLK